MGDRRCVRRINFSRLFRPVTAGLADLLEENKHVSLSYRLGRADLLRSGNPTENGYRR